MAKIKSIDPAVSEMLEQAEKEGLSTAFSRAEDMKPCPIGHVGRCCKHCHMGPCRLMKPGQTGVCGATIETVTARNLVRMIAGGASAHSDHGRDLALTLLAVAEGEAPDYRIRDKGKLLLMAEYLGVPIKGREILEIAQDVGSKALSQFGQQTGELLSVQRAPKPRQEIWRRLGMVPRGIDREVVEVMHRTHVGNDQDHESLLKAGLRCALADGWGGSMLATDLTDVLFGTPSPLSARSNLGILSDDEVNLIVHGHEPTLSEMIAVACMDPEMIEYAKSKGAKGINLAGICCTANEVLMRQGVGTIGNFLSQELAVMTGAIELMVVDIQCIMEALSPLCERYHTSLVTTSPKVHIHGATHIGFDEHRALDIAKQIVRMACDNYPKRGKTHIPQFQTELVAGFSHEYLNYLMGGYYRGSFRPLNDAIMTGRLRGVAGVVGCNNPRTSSHDAAHDYVTREFIKNDILVVQTGCGAISAAKFGLLAPEAAMELAGPGLREICETLGIPPVLHLGSCVDNSRILTTLAQMANEGGLGTDISDIPGVGLAPEWMSEKAISIGCYFVASGVYTIMGGKSPVEASEVVSEYISKVWEEQLGGKYEFIEEPEEMVARSLAHIDAKRQALGLPDYDPTRYGASGDGMLLRYLEAVEKGEPASLYSTKGL
ncbi:MAG: anaerobic carbon-monoxide dehydrogenase catalytic subunit [Chloroflexia bacterium]|nr:anaerobic carbon-monoxide dehydrogenase catalytic subunit [Chloroflexia bacterium]